MFMILFSDTIEWPFSIDLDPEFVYQKCKK